MISNKKILIIKHGALGDIFMSFKSIKSISNCYSNITICSTNSGFKALKMLDVKFEKIFDNRGNLYETSLVLKKIISKKFDIVIDLQNSKRSSMYLCFLKIFCSSELNGTSFFANKRYIKKNLNEHVTKGLENQLKMINVLSPKKTITPSKSKSNHVVIIPGSSLKGKHKRWPILNFIELMNYLAQKKITSYVIGGKDEKDIVTLIPKNKYIINLINKSPWDKVKKISLKSKIIISNDTSAMHYISNLDVPVIALMNDDIYAIRNSPRSISSVVLKNKNVKNISLKKVINEVNKFI